MGLGLGLEILYLLVGSTLHLVVVLPTWEVRDQWATSVAGWAPTLGCQTRRATLKGTSICNRIIQGIFQEVHAWGNMEWAHLKGNSSLTYRSSPSRDGDRRHDLAMICAGVRHR